MSEFHINVVRLGKMREHPNADTLNIVNIFDYPVITKKGGFKEGELVVYIPVDSVVPDTEDWHFLCPLEDGKPKYPVGEVPEKYRVIEAKKLRGIFSQGMLAPLPDSNLSEGDDVRELMNITKYEPKEPVMMGGECEPAPNGWQFSTYTDIEGMRRYPNIIETGEQVVLTEKLHGCFVSSTKVTMIDGTKRKISSLNVGDVVLGVDSAGNTTPSKVLKTWVKNAGSDTKWVRIRLTRKKVKSGNSYCSLTCTSDHQIAVKTENGIEWKDAGKLDIAETVLIHRSDLSIPELQKQILLGMLLGDASTGGKNHSWSLTWSHSKKDEGYVDWIERGLGDVFLKGFRRERNSGYNSTCLTGRTIWSNDIKNCFFDFYDNDGKKKIPERIIDILTPLSIAFWYMDDGSLGHGDGENQDNTASFATCSFSVDDCEKLVRALARYQIEATISNYDYPRINLNASNAEKLFILIAPYIPPAMQRKLPPRYRGGPGWLPPVGAVQRYTQLVEQKVILNTEIESRSRLWDITTETGNFFAHETLVHNSNARYVHDGERLWVGSHTQIKKFDERNMWWKQAIKDNLEEKLSHMPMHIFFGEVYGQVQDLKYGINSGTEFRVFDVFDVKRKTYLDFHEAKRAAEACSLRWVPILFEGPWDPTLGAHAEGKSTLADNVREGFVIRPITERWNEKIGRVILKRHGEGYLLRKKKK